MIPLVQAVEAAGVTYRQADYWCRQGYIQASWFSHGLDRHPLDHGGFGSGSNRWLTPFEARVLHTMGRLVRAGLSAQVAAQVARDIGYGDRASYQIAPGVTLLVTDHASLTEERFPGVRRGK